MRPAYGLHSQEMVFLKADEIGKQRLLTQPRLAGQSPVASAFRVSEGQLFRCPVTHSIPVSKSPSVQIETRLNPTEERGFPMPKNDVTDPITDQEMAFALLVMSGTMNDRQAAAAVGLNPDSAAYTKAKPRVRAYMIEHRAAVRKKLVDEEADRLRNLNLGRDRILTRLWELAALSSEATRGSIAGQIKALSMISAIEGFIPSRMNDRRLSPSATQPVATPRNAQIDDPSWRPKDQPVAEQLAHPPASAPADPVAPRVPQPPLAHEAGQLNPFVFPQPRNRVPAPTTSIFDVALNAINSVQLPYSAKLSEFAHSR
jgi:hypothetical protein